MKRGRAGACAVDGAVARRCERVARRKKALATSADAGAGADRDRCGVVSGRASTGLVTASYDVRARRTASDLRQKSRSVNSLFAAALELQSFCTGRQFRFCFIGGLAVQRWGDPRL